MPTNYYTSNAALQYNQTNNMADYFMDAPSTTKKFLTAAPQTRILAENELSALYFLCSPINMFAYYEYYENNTLITSAFQYIDETALKYHNAISVNWSGAPANANKMAVYLFGDEDAAKISETRYFIRAESTCIENQIVWLNKLGGYDSFMFTGGLESSITAVKETEIENPFNTNFLSPFAITSYRSINSNKQIKIAHRCANNETAQWLKNELINSADIYIVEDLVYKPVLMQDANVGYNSYSKEFIVTFNLKFAFPINIQTR
jgi:hypothetical protein